MTPIGIFYSMMEVKCWNHEFNDGRVSSENIHIGGPPIEGLNENINYVHGFSG